MGKLFLMDGIFLPMEGYWTFETLHVDDARLGIQRAIDGGAVVELVRDKDSARYLSKVLDREIKHNPKLKQQGIGQLIKDGDAVMLLPYYTRKHLSFNMRTMFVAGVSFDL